MELVILLRPTPRKVENQGNCRDFNQFPQAATKFRAKSARFCRENRGDFVDFVILLRAKSANLTKFHAV
jgi:hypothetical protein